MINPFYLLNVIEGATDVFASIFEVTIAILASRSCTSLKEFGSSTILSPHPFGTEGESRLTMHLEVQGPSLQVLSSPLGR